MRLLHLPSLVNSRIAKFETFYGVAPQFAILSHTWEEQEISFQEIQNPDQSIKHKRGYAKLVAFAKSALFDGYHYGWIDTCCIDKTNLVEFSEAINSMFKWYEQASHCFVYLSDVTPSDPIAPYDRYNLLAKSKWFTRGWTLQELIAPTEVTFYNHAWKVLFDKRDCAEILAKITLIDIALLQGDQDLFSFTIAERMSWASKRETTRPEDMAYSLLGIFGINMPLLYGEGATNAFTRLQEEIIKKSNDHTILGWEMDSAGNSSAFAPSPRFFAGGHESLQHNLDGNFSYERSPYLMTNMGLRIRLPLIRVRPGSSLYLAVLDCHSKATDGMPKCIALQAVSDDDRQFVRYHTSKSYSVQEFRGYRCIVCEIYIQTTPMTKSNSSISMDRSKASMYWSTDDIEAETLAREIGLIGTTQDMYRFRDVHRETWIFGLTLIFLLLDYYPAAVTEGWSALPESNRIFITFIGAIFMLHRTSMDMYRAVLYYTPYVARKLTARGIRFVYGERSQHNIRDRGVPFARDGFASYVRTSLEVWALRKTTTSWRWRNAGLVRRFENDRTLATALQPILKLSNTITVWSFLIHMARFFHRSDWMEYIWLWGLLGAVLSLSYDYSIDFFFAERPPL